MIEWLSSVGTASHVSMQHHRNIVLSNRIAFGLGCVTIGFLALYVIYFLRWDVLYWFLLGSSFAFIVPIALNYANLNQLSRFVLSGTLPVLTLTASIVGKLYGSEPIDESGYYDYRFILLAASLFPFLYISLSEKGLLVVSILMNFLPMALYDPVLNWIGIGYYQTHQDDQSYYFSGILILACYGLMTVSMLALKSFTEKLEQRNQSLIAELEASNNTLFEMNLSVSTQNEEIISQNEGIARQAEELTAQREKLKEALKTIAKQQRLLESENRNLGSQLIEQNQTLSQVNAELVKYNNDLRQFSYTISHNLRGPIASLLGLGQLVQKDNLNDFNKEILEYILTTTHRLDSIIKDLNKIIDIRHDIFRVREKISLREIISEIEQMLEREIESYGIQVIKQFEPIATVYMVRPMLSSILYNLLSNAIKYHSPDRSPVISISMKEDAKSYSMQVEDNGLGIDLEKQGENIFKLYKRFHLHTEGKGIGLYLVKQQTEALGGTITVSSKPNQFTLFTLTFPKPENTEFQVLYEEKFATIFYNATLNACGVIWNGVVTSEQYREVYLKCLEFLGLYNTQNWIADPSRQGYVSMEDQQWLMKTIVPEAVARGLKRIASVKPSLETPSVISYHSNNKIAMEQKGIPVRFFDTLEECMGWIRTQQ
jgi:signal transduction histidine kinase